MRCVKRASCLINEEESLTVDVCQPVSHVVSKSGARPAETVETKLGTTIPMWLWVTPLLIHINTVKLQINEANESLYAVKLG